jgi:DNA polymerase-4
LILENARELLYQEKMKDSVRLLGISLSNLNTDKSEKKPKEEKEIEVQLKFEF